MLNGKCALIAGFTSRIGLGYSASLAATGGEHRFERLRSGRRIERQRNDIERGFGVRTIHDDGDMSDARAIESLMDFPIDKWNAILAISVSAALSSRPTTAATRIWP